MSFHLISLALRHTPHSSHSEQDYEKPRMEYRPDWKFALLDRVLQCNIYSNMECIKNWSKKSPRAVLAYSWSPFCVVDVPMECSYPPCFIRFLSTSTWQSVPPPPLAHAVNHDVVSAAVRVCSFQWILKPSIAKGHSISQTKPAPSSSAAEIGLVCFLLATDVLLVYKALRC